VAVIFVGDLHFSDDKDWKIAVGHKMIDWMKNFPENKKENTLVLSGDITDKSLNTGTVYKMLEDFIRACTFKKIYIIKGNHDIHYKNGVQSYTGDHLRTNPKIVILDKPGEVLEIEGFKVLSLPHYTFLEGYPNMEHYYSNLYKKVKEVDIIAGHISDESLPLFSNIDLSKITAKWRSLGHIHSPMNNSYLGSLYPTSISEYAGNRFYHKYVHGQPKVIGKIPILLKYEQVIYPQKAKINKEYIQVFTVLNYPTKVEDSTIYKDLYIKQRISGKLIDVFDEELGTSDILKEINSPREIINKCLEDNNFSDSVKQLVRSYLL